jgi:hypothetical protein
MSSFVGELHYLLEWYAEECNQNRRYKLYPLTKAIYNLCERHFLSK